MKEERIYFVNCPHCNNRIQIRDLLPNGTKISLFADLIVNDGNFTKDKSFVCISGTKRKVEQKEEQITFVKRDETKRLF